MENRAIISHEIISSIKPYKLWMEPTLDNCGSPTNFYHYRKKSGEISIDNRGIICQLYINEQRRHSSTRASFINMEKYLDAKHDAYDDKITGIKGRLSNTEKAVKLDAIIESYGKSGDIDYFLNRNYNKTLKNYNKIMGNIDMIEGNYFQLLSAQSRIEELTKQVEALTAKVEALEA